jgi:hypothetical protein
VLRNPLAMEPTAAARDPTTESCIGGEIPGIGSAISGIRDGYRCAAASGP